MLYICITKKNIMITAKILNQGKRVQHWPDTTPKYIECQVVSDGKTFTTELHETVVDINLFLNSIKISDSDRKKLYTLISQYGETQYNKGCESVSDEL